MSDWSDSGPAIEYGVLHADGTIGKTSPPLTHAREVVASRNRAWPQKVANRLVKRVVVASEWVLVDEVTPSDAG